MLYLFVALILSLLINLAMVYLHYREKEQLQDRLMARDLQEYKHFQEEYPEEVKHKKEVLKDRREAEKKISPEEHRVKNAAGRF